MFDVDICKQDRNPLCVRGSDEVWERPQKSLKELQVDALFFLDL